MSLNDTTSDMIARIRNAHTARLTTLDCIYSGLNKGILEILKEEGYIEDFSLNEKDKKLVLRVELRYIGKEAAIKIIERVSTPGKRIYKQIKKLDKFKNGLGVNIISTSKGVMSDYQCMIKNLGGEVICRVF